MELDLKEFFKDLILENSSPQFTGTEVLVTMNATQFDRLTSLLEEHAVDFRNMP